MKDRLSRRVFSKTMALGLGAASLTQLSAQKPRKLLIGHTGITWMTFGGGPARGGAAGGPAVDVNRIETIIRDISGLGYHGVELFGDAVADMEAYGGLGRVLLKYNNTPLIAIVASPNCGVPARLKESIQTMVQQGTAAKKQGARIVLTDLPPRHKAPGLT